MIEQLMNAKIVLVVTFASWYGVDQALKWSVIAVKVIENILLLESLLYVLGISQ